MFNSGTAIYLASKSPRRKKLLKQINLTFKSFSVELKEEILDGEHPIKTVKRLAAEKMALAEKRVEKGIIITADTIVVLDKEVIGKPISKKNAFEILSKLSGNKHNVYTGFVVKNVSNGREIISYEKTSVTFRELQPKEIMDYIEGGSPMDKAGAYGIQDDFGSVFIKKINGCYYNVVGLPLAKVYQSLLKMV
ncbi:MAG: septum formation protein Maf [Bacteroidetes bacterium]|nr:septum formation protein Maf [Bacteroidota bacterium]